MFFLNKLIQFRLDSLLRLTVESFLVVIFSCLSMSAFSINASGNNISVQNMSAKAPKETMHFGRIVGQWEIKDQSLGKDGKWQNGPGANWNFYWILGGSAIQDDWVSPGFKTPAPKAGRQFGTNIRIYNPKEKVWEMAWMSNSGKKLDTFKATSDDNSMIMSGLYNGQVTRITFYDISKNRFSWKMEVQDKKSKQWTSNYKIEAYRIQE